MIGGFGFFIALLPSLFKKGKPERSSSIMTGSILLVSGITQATLGLWLTSVSTVLVSIEWFILAIQVSRRIT